MFLCSLERKTKARRLVLKYFKQKLGNKRTQRLLDKSSYVWEAHLFFSFPYVDFGDFKKSGIHDSDRSRLHYGDMIVRFYDLLWFFLLLFFIYSVCFACFFFFFACVVYNVVLCTGGRIGGGSDIPVSLFLVSLCSFFLPFVLWFYDACVISNSCTHLLFCSFSGVWVGFVVSASRPLCLPVCQPHADTWLIEPMILLYAVVLLSVERVLNWVFECFSDVSTW